MRCLRCTDPNKSPNLAQIKAQPKEGKIDITRHGQCSTSKIASYKQQAEALNKLNAFADRNKTNFNKRDAVLHEINRHRENQASSIKFRKNVLESQKRANYVNEYDRLRGAMLSGLVRESSNKYINERMGKLKELASESIHGKQHSIFYEKTDEQKSDKELIPGSVEQTKRELMKQYSELESNLAELTRIRGGKAK